MENIYMNRELSWLKFNERVLEEAENNEVPLCERMNFVSIYQSNLDEFFRVRVGSLQDQMLVNKKIRDNKTNMTSEEQIKAILKEVKRLNKRKDAAYADLMKKVAEYGITLVDFKTAKPEEKKFLEQYFNHEIVPLSSPTIVGKRQPFPFLRNQEIYAVVVLETRSGKERIGIIPCTNNMVERLVEIPGGEGRYVLSENIVLHYIGKVFKGYKVIGKSLIRVVRNADIDADALYDEDLDYREFMADLMKRIDIPCEVSFVKLASYQGAKSTGRVKELIGLNENLEGRTVVIVEDIVDSGLTMQRLVEQLAAHCPDKIHIVTLLLKPDRLMVNLDIEYVAMRIPNDFIVGYGLDYDGLGRNYKDIYTVVSD